MRGIERVVNELIELAGLGLVLESEMHAVLAGEIQAVMVTEAQPLPVKGIGRGLPPAEDLVEKI